MFSYSLDTINEAAAWLDKNITYPIISFQGPMGIGKTTLISALLDLWQTETGVSSPTFSLVNEYLTHKKGLVYHFDFYRLNSETEASDIGVEEYLDSGNICLLEWAEKIPSLLPNEIHRIKIEDEGNNRILSIT